MTDKDIEGVKPGPETHNFIFKDLVLEQLTETTIAQRSSVTGFFEPKVLQAIYPIHLELNSGSFASLTNPDFPLVTLVSDDQQILISCSCETSQQKLCEHGALVITAVLKRDEFSIFFNKTLRHEKLRKFAGDYGLGNETQLDPFFKIEYLDHKFSISPAIEGLLPVTKKSMEAIRYNVKSTVTNPVKGDPENHTCVIFRQHKYDRYLMVELYAARLTKEGKIKNPLTAIDPLDLIWTSEHADHIKFFSAITKFQGPANNKRSVSDISALKAILKNPLSYDFYFHDETASENLAASSAMPFRAKVLAREVILEVSYQAPFYKLSVNVNINGTTHSLQDLRIKYTYFLALKNTLYLVDKPEVLSLLAFLKQQTGEPLIHSSKFKEFKEEVLKPLADKITVLYTYVKEGTALQKEEQGFMNEKEKLIYISDFGTYVMLTPVVRYSDVEIPIRSKRLIYALDQQENEFRVERDEEAEINLIALLSKQHPDFEEQVTNDMDYFSLHKKYFLDESWFLSTFDDWRKQGITILGFNTLEENKLNPHKVSIDIKVISGLNWFNALIDVRFGKKKASLKRIQKAVRKKSKYIQLDDGTLGILPQDWMEKFQEYFNAGESITENSLRISKSNFSELEELFDEEALDGEVKKEISVYKEKLSDFSTIKAVKIPKGLTGILRPYQQQGLNWLNFLDDFNFGGCLADDMGLGKSIQILAFILSQRTKSDHNTNLIVAPTTLIFNWQAEIQKFAPSLKVLVLHGTERKRSAKTFDSYEVVLTSYTTLLTDIYFLKDYKFNYIFLDESQNIKNPGTQRYRTVRLLQSRNKVVMTGTPIENNTFDLYSQMSFACPGLLGSKHYFREVYSTPVDKFKSSKRAKELQEKIKPFLLRRTKEQVAKELPDKQEMVLYCDMKEDQRKIYDAYEKEFREYISATTNDELDKSPMNVLKGLTRLRQICDAPALLPDGELTQGSSSKIEMLLEQIEDKAPGHKILVFSQFVSMLDLIKAELIKSKIPFSYLTGATKNRRRVVNEFQENKDIRVFLISLKAGGTGLNLTEADCVYLVDPWWNPAVENQAIDRAHRIGQSKKVMAFRLICPNTVEEKIMKLQASKKDLAEDLIKTDASFMKSLSKKELLSLFS